MAYTHLANLQGPEDRPRFNPKPKSSTPTRLQEKAMADKDDAAKLAIWRKQVYDRDEGKCRHCGVRCVKTRMLHPRRAEANHIERRDTLAVRYDTRNGVLLCASCHERVTGKVNDRLEIVGTMWFIKEGRRYINGDFQVHFKKVA